MIWSTIAFAALLFFAGVGAAAVVGDVSSFFRKRKAERKGGAS